MGRVLVIDDCEEFREVVADLLSEAGHQVLTVDSPDCAMAAWKFARFDVVVCDLVMPMPNVEDYLDDAESAMVGVHAIHEISKQFPGVPVVAVSGKLTGEPLKAVNNFGAFATLSKPFAGHQLLSIIDEALSSTARPLAD